MKSPVYLMVLLQVSLAVPLAHSEEPSAVVRPEVEELLSTYRSDANDPANLARAQNELTNRPDIKPDLIAALKREYFKPDRDTNPNVSAAVLGAMCHRGDLTPDEVNLITGELQRFIGVPSDATPSGSQFMGPALLLLGQYPSEAHESLVIQFLDRDPKEDNLLVCATKTLQSIGGTRSLEAMRGLVKRLKGLNPNWTFIGDIETHIAGLEARLRETAAMQTGGSTYSPDGPNRSAKPSGKPEMADRLDGQPSNSSAFGKAAIMAVLIAGVGIALLLARNALRPR